MNVDPRQHEAHEIPLASRLITAEITEWLRANLAIAAAATPTPDGRAAIDRVRHLDLAGVDYRLTPRLIDALRRAGCLREDAR